ncbi:N-formimino-L-glutamate deiminase [Bradyrhizobium macuxiense]|uniref:N-formimino-L-glutamate deiminase n=1 Tax=Bradyrhizobium macuxiense TaxID=1755647 RepID=A0A120FNR1_9BRAD|nr:formimidoylglutamate deiminase [Bradyrhizobium macuxiense]KWV55776.1 N-formimino-L-glutamate deiminase [Bradyrhizobium macuxiense]
MPELHFKQALLPGGWLCDVLVSIKGGHIAAVSTGVAASDACERHAIGLPGLPNLHSHGFQRGMAGLTEIRSAPSDSFWTWRDLMYRFVDRMTPDDVEAITAQAYVEMLEAGFTRVGEFHYLHHDPSGVPYDDIAELAGRIAAAAKASGIGLTLLPVFYAHGGFGGRAPDPGQRRFLNTVDRFARLVDGSRRAVAECDSANVGIAPHSLRAITPDELAAIVPLGGGAPVHIHVAEQTREVDDCIAWSGARPVRWLLDHAPVDHRWCLIHATHMTGEESRAMAVTGAVAGLCPMTEANLGDGIFDTPTFGASGGRFGVGTDSNVLIGVADELRQLEYSQRLALRVRNVMATPRIASTGRALFDAALAGAAQALGVAGGLAPGLAADIVSLDAERSALAGRSGDAILDGWIFGSPRPLVDCVWTSGRKVVTKGRHHLAESVAAMFRRRLEGLLAE